MTIRWPAESMWEQVVPLLPGFTVEILPQIDSTNTELMRRARAGQLEPTLLVAERQTAGRGRLGRGWQSDTDAGLATLTFSLGLPLQPADWSGLSLAVGLAVVQSLHPALLLKWPNDVWLDERKLAGILIETTSVNDLRYCVIGIGINLMARSSTGLRTPAAALQDVLAVADAPSTLQAIVLPLVQAVQRFEREGFGPLRPVFHTRDLLYGREVVCTDGTTGTARGVDAGGALLVHTGSGLQKISSAEVSVRPVPAASSPMKP
jgi:BirA family biotin operon repressor/biotin-[acetyl-CoA-carboxylase] ligase